MYFDELRRLSHDMLNFWSHYIVQIWHRQVQHHRRVALFGAGEHSKWLLDVVEELPGPEVVGLIDDRAELIPELRGRRVVTPQHAGSLGFDAIVISSDASEAALYARARACFPSAKIVRLYEGLPPGPYDKHSDIVPNIETLPGPGDTINLDTVVALAMDAQTKQKLIAVFGKLDPDPFVGRMVDGYRRAIERFGSHWKYIDLWSLLYAYTVLARPKRYLEIGTRRGHSMAVVCAAALEAESNELQIVSCDQWIENYAGQANPGPEFVTEQMARLGYNANVRFLCGSSHETLPSLFQDPTEHFDLVTVDGDHSRQGAFADLEDVVDHVRMGGMLAFDDINHPQHPYLGEVWHRAMDGRQEFETYTNPRNATGIAAAIRYR